MAKERILIVDDEEDIAELVQYNLEREGYLVDVVHSGEEALAFTKSAANNAAPDLVILDLMLPGVNGLDVCRTLKGSPATASIPIIMLTARGEETDVVIGLEMGADDYITKPFSPRILVARVRSIFRKGARSAPPKERTVEVENIVINPGKHEVLIDGDNLELTPTEFGVLYFLACNRGWVYTRQQIVTAVHGDDYPVTDRSVDVQITGLRRKLGECGPYIETVRGVGYRFKE